MTQELWLYAYDEEDALDRCIFGGAKEFSSLDQAVRGFDHEDHSGKSIFRILCEKVAEAPEQ